jgi:hypothetical protein
MGFSNWDAYWRDPQIRTQIKKRLADSQPQEFQDRFINLWITSKAFRQAVKEDAPAFTSKIVLWEKLNGK